ncbi:RNA 2',3'-cyclic phosphodiesterase [Litchfieldia alkalitelluris]|uniref:RNA 2',3'-cyclic phosphodiesterase n=1 Tax=Litchfieldia alkalitelluris TaxID=304268 RepID=UPI0014745685|nr:RNA 2',3'-cyclic phosphodiesterase [Litchfieldia alkalitelluris]
MADAHYFLAVPLSDDARTILSDWREELKEEVSFKSWVHPLDFHITLAFLGSASEKAISLTKEKIGAISSFYPAFQLEINGLGTFGKQESPRVFWAGVQHSEALIKLQKKVHEACKEVGFSLDSRPYSPHITLARRWKEKSPLDVKKIQTFNIQAGVTSFPVQEMILYQTHLNRTPKYEAISRFSLMGE